MTLRMILLSPLVHFFLLGGLIFGSYALVEDEPERPAVTAEAITLTPQQAARLAEQFAATWNRPPSVEELEGLMRAWVLEEAHVREARALGLDRGDAVIRQRLNLKMQFLAESGAAALAPDDATLQAYLDDHRDDFLRPARVAFEQVQLPPGQGDEARAIRAALESDAAPSSLGTPSLLPTSLAMTPAPAVDRLFGQGFHAALAEAPRGRWHGPVESAYGRHLVRVTGRAEAVLPPLGEIRARVEGEWRAAQTREMRESFAQALLERYAVTTPEAAEVLAP
ncbi:peptidyl-prolyl cis-trans isomerase [Halomonas denitrificans]|uniref:peptidylprolyl isomerase n=1 Tax=Halomonas denitrificans TaxID=370769 RepID=UPI000D394E0D|nr:peptidylprolyl isomerase [Halomonas denitrificans]